MTTQTTVSDYVLLQNSRRHTYIKRYVADLCESLYDSFVQNGGMLLIPDNALSKNQPVRFAIPHAEEHEPIMSVVTVLKSGVLTYTTARVVTLTDSSRVSIPKKHVENMRKWERRYFITDDNIFQRRWDYKDLGTLLHTPQSYEHAVMFLRYIPSQNLLLALLP